MPVSSFFFVQRLLPALRSSLGRSARAKVGAHARIAFRRAPRTPKKITRENLRKKTALPVHSGPKNQAFKKPCFSARPEPTYPNHCFAPIFAFFFLGPGARQKSDFMQLKKSEGAPLAENLAKKTVPLGTSPRSASCEQENLARALMTTFLRKKH